MINNIKLLTMGYNPHCRSCEIATTVGTYTIIGIYKKVGLNCIKANYYVMDSHNQSMCIKVYSEILMSEYINSEIIDMAFHKGMQRYMKYIEKYYEEVKKFGQKRYGV